MTRRLQLDDLARFVSVSDPQLAPSLRSLAYVTARIDERKDGYDTTIWVVTLPEGNPAFYLNGEDDHSPRWSPDGRQLLFLSRRGFKQGEKGNSLWLTPADRAEPRLVLRMDEAIEQPQWMPDGRSILFLSNLGRADEEVRVIDRIPIWSDNAGFTYYKRRHLHLVDADSGNVTRLTEGDFSVASAAASHKGRWVSYAASKDDFNPWRSDIYVHSLDSEEHLKLAEGFFVEALSWAPDDSHILFLGSPLTKGYATHTGVWALPRRGGPAENLTHRLDRGCSRRVYYDLRSAYAATPAPVWDKDHIYFPLSEGGRFNLYRLHFLSRRVEAILTGDFSIEEFAVKDGVIAYTKVSGMEPAEVWLKDTAGDRRITAFNDPLLSTLTLSVPERFEFRASDGETVEGWVLKPRWLGGKGPAIVDIHGGPKSKFGYSFIFEHQLYAAEGYTVMYVNPRGSDGYSQEFGDIRQAWGRRDYQDLIEAIDHMVASYDSIDPEKLGVTGISYGGYMTNWVVTHTDRFKAAVSQNGISHMTAFYGTTDIGFFFAPEQVGGNPWTNEQGYRDVSPLTYAPRVTTPILFIHSYEDYRCWIDQSITFYTALKHLGKETKLILFMQGSHGFRSLGKPSMRRKRLEHMLQWFHTHLKEKPDTGGNAEEQ